MYDAELIETKKKVDAMLLLKDIKYLQGYEQGKTDAIDEFARSLIEEGKKIKYLRHLWIESTCKKIAEQLKEQMDD